MEHVEELLELLAKGRLAAGEKQKVEHHLAVCERCAKTYQILASRYKMISESLGPRASDRLVSQTLKKIYAEAKEQGKQVALGQRFRAWFRPYSHAAMAFAGVFLVCLIGVLVVQKDTAVRERMLSPEPVITPVLPLKQINQKPENKKNTKTKELERQDYPASVNKVQGLADFSAAVGSALIKKEAVVSNLDKITSRKKQEESKDMQVKPEKTKLVSKFANPVAAVSQNSGFAWKSEINSPVSEQKEDTENVEVPSSKTSLSFSRVVKGTFNPAKGEQALVVYTLLKPSPVVLRVFNSSGGEVVTLLDADQEAGDHQAVWDGLDKQSYLVTSGSYRIVIQTLSYKETQVVVVTP